MLSLTATRGRRVVAAGAVVTIASTLLQWWQIGGGAGELPLRSDVGISDGRVFLMFLASVACLLVMTLPLAARKPISVDHPATYLGLFGVAAVGYAIRTADLAGQHLVPLPPTHGLGFWLAGVGLAVMAGGAVATAWAFPRRDVRDVRDVGDWEPEEDSEEVAESAGGAVEPVVGSADAADSAGSAATTDAATTATDPDPSEAPESPQYVPAWTMSAWRWLSRPSTRPDRSAALDSEPRGRLDRMDLWVLVALVTVLLSMRVFSLGQPTAMYFDEVYHARTATEFLQDWRYGIPHDAYEWTHPMLAKYAIAGGITAFSNDKVTGTGNLGVPAVADARVQIRTVNSPGAAVQPDPAAQVDYGTNYGDRVFVATGSEVRVYDLQTRTLAHAYEIPGASAISDPSPAGVVYIGTSDGKVYSIDTNSLDDVRAGRSAVVKPASPLGVDAGIKITHVYAGTPPYVLVSDATGNVVAIDTTKGSGEIAGRIVVPGAADYIDFGVGAFSDPEVLVACSAGVVTLDVRQMTILATVETDAPATSLALNPDLMGPPEALFYRYYATAGDSLLLLHKPSGTTPPTIWLEADQPLAKMPGAVTKVLFDQGTKIAQVLGRTSDGTGWTVYAVEGNGNAVFSDARLPFEPVAIGLDNAVQVSGPSQVVQMPDANREALLAFGPDGSTASVDVGQFAFSWRIVGVLFGALTAVCLYLLARILFRRRSVGLLMAFFTLVDGMLFAQSRIAMNDTYVAGFLLLGYLIFAVLWLKVWKNRFAFWLGMPLLGVLLGLALASKWVALYAIASIAFLILIRSALGRLMAILGLAAGTGVLGWMAVAEMRYQPGTGSGTLCLLLIGGAVVVVGAGTLLAMRTRLVPDKVFVAVAAAAVAGVLFAGALLASPGTLQNGAPNYTFFIIMLAITAIAAAANAYRPVAWTREEFYFAVGAPAVLGLIGPVVVSLLLVPIGFHPGIASVAKVAAEGALAGVALGAGAAAAFWAAGKIGFGPLASAPRPGSVAELAGPPSPAPDGWLRLGSGFGFPTAWMGFCLAVLPFVIYIVMYVPWAMPWHTQTDESGPLPAIACWQFDTTSRSCIDAWPAGHTGQTLWDLTNEMYTYHDQLRLPHPASSPWWAWPLDLKPVWFASGGDVPGMFSWIHDGGTPVLWWMAIVGMGFASWQALRRRNLGLGLIAVAFFWQWLSWARIDRATFEYHFYTALPFFLMALAYFLAELWHGPSRRTWLLARIAGVAVLLTPGVLWLLKPELCGLARVDPREYFQSTVCGAGTGDVVITTRIFLIVAVLVAALVALGAILWRLERRHARGLEDRAWLVQLLAPVAVSFVAIAWVGGSGPNGVLIRAALPSDTLTAFPVLLGAVFAYIAITARNPRRFVLGFCMAAVLAFAFLYPDLSALWMPNTIQGIYSVLSPTWMYGFIFSTNQQVSNTVKLVSTDSGIAVLAALLVAGVAAWIAWERRVVVGWRRAKLLAGAGEEPAAGEEP